MTDSEFEGVTVTSTDGTLTGTATGTTSPCQMQSCRGVRVWVRWSDGTLTKPCSKGLLPGSRGTLYVS